MNILTLDGEVKIIQEEVKKFDIAIGIGNLYYSADLLIDLANGKIIGIEITKYNTIKDCEFIRKLIDDNFIKQFYIVPLYRDFLEIYHHSKNETYIEQEFHIWAKGTTFVLIEEWFTDNNLGYYEFEYEMVDYM
ncbi:MAG: hypothetical protein RR620_08515 [Clostridium sp.]